MPNDNTLPPKTDDQTKVVDTSSPPIFVDSGDAPPMLNTKPSADVINPSPVTINIDSSSVAPANDIVTPIMPAVVTSGPPKKKYAGGKIIATILGLFLLVGGIGAGVYLTGQNQNIAEKADDSGYRNEQKCTKAGSSPKWCWDNSGDCEGDTGYPVACSQVQAGWEADGFDCNPVTEPCANQSGGNDDSTPPPAIPTPTPPSAGVPVCQSASISKTSLSGPGDSLTITSTATTSDITGFLYGFYNLDSLYGPGNPKIIWFTPNTDYTHAETVSPTNSHTTTVTYDELNRPDLNWNSQKPTKIQVNAFFGNSAGSTHSDPNCVVQFNITLASTVPTISCTSLTSSVANPTVGQSITGTCRGNVTGTSSAVARFAVSLNGTVLGASEAIPLNSAGTASYTASVPQEGNYLVQCQICTDSTLSNCTTMGQAN